MNRKTLPTKPLRKLVYSSRAVASCSPSLYLPFARRKYSAIPDRIVESDTELVIEGFQRSGNTFAAIAFEIAQPRPVKTAHHLHAAAQIVRAVELGVPTLVLIREPEQSTLSHMVREPGISARQALGNWVRFYETVVPLSDRVVTADFREVTTDFGPVIRTVNERFATNFAEFEHTDENVERVFELIERRNVERYGAVTETTVARPSAERAQRKSGLKSEYGGREMNGLRERAAAVYRTLVPTPSTP